MYIESETETMASVWKWICQPTDPSGGRASSAARLRATRYAKLRVTTENWKAKVWYLTLHRWLGDRDEAISSSLVDHLAWLREQQLAGRVLFSGPSVDGELGIIVFGHMSRAEFDDLCRQEPFVARGYRGFEVIAWEVHQLLGIGGFDVEAIAAMTRSERA
jgi:uncharacterized protein YciI